MKDYGQYKIYVINGDLKTVDTNIKRQRKLAMQMATEQAEKTERGYLIRVTIDRISITKPVGLTTIMAMLAGRPWWARWEKEIESIEVEGKLPIKIEK